MADTPDNSRPASIADHPGVNRLILSSLPRGVYVPMLAFFNAAEEVDLAATQRHTARLLAAGVAGLVVHGSNGEAVHLSRQERRSIIQAVVDATRHAEERVHSHLIPIIAGCSAQGLRETVELCQDAKEAGATHAIILPPGYYASTLGKEGIVKYFYDVADASPIPVLIYNFPAAANGVDLDSDTILRIAKHPNVVGVKLTCGNTGKLARIVAETQDGDKEFFVGGGSADFILQGLIVGAHGTVSGFANLAPHACIRIIDLFDSGRLVEARALQHQVARADWLAIQHGFNGVKAAMPMFHGEIERTSTQPRKPFSRMETDSPTVSAIWEGMKDVVAIEADIAQDRAVAGNVE